MNNVFVWKYIYKMIFGENAVFTNLFVSGYICFIWEVAKQIWEGKEQDKMYRHAKEYEFARFCTEYEVKYGSTFFYHKSRDLRSLRKKMKM